MNTDRETMTIGELIGEARPAAVAETMKKMDAACEHVTRTEVMVAIGMLLAAQSPREVTDEVMDIVKCVMLRTYATGFGSNDTLEQANLRDEAYAAEKKGKMN
jgi:hypothetical protein